MISLHSIYFHSCGSLAAPCWALFTGCVSSRWYRAFITGYGSWRTSKPFCRYYWCYERVIYDVTSVQALVLLTRHHVFTYPIYLPLPFVRPRCLNTVWPGEEFRKRHTDWTYCSSASCCILFVYCSHFFLHSFIIFFSVFHISFPFPPLFKTLRGPIFWGAFNSSGHS